VRHAVLASAVDLVTAEGADAATIPAIAARAGVNSSSVYRRWGNREAVLLDALLEAADDAAPIPRTGDLREDLIALLRDVQTMLASPLGDAMVKILLLSPGDDSLADLRRTYWSRRLEHVGQILRAAVERGQLPADTDVAFTIELLVGPLHTRALFSGSQPDPAVPARIIDRVLPIRPNRADSGADRPHGQAGIAVPGAATS
jgi:AcrR family transcriptional regulator